MTARILQGKLVLRSWDRATGLTETPQPFSSLDELYTYCLAAGDPHLIDRIVIHGRDQQGYPRVVTFTFQSITVSPEG